MQTPYNPLVSFCIPVYKTEKYLERTLRSLMEQDYKNWEAIVCFDGVSNEGVQIVKRLQSEDERFRWIGIEHKGAPAARNAAFKESKGEIISFFDSDCILLPGALRTWVMAFEENQDIDFVYGGYRFNDAQYSVLPSKEFDPYILETNNYIASMFPIKRDKVLEWDESLKSLQDWDFWLRVVKAGGKGKYIRDITIMTEPSYMGSGSVSDDSASNWIERIKTVKTKNNIPIRPVCVSSLGAPFQGIYRAKVLDADFREMPSEKPHEYKMILLQGFYPYAGSHHRAVFAGAPKDCLKVVNWIGTDVWQMRQLKFDQTMAVAKVLMQQIDFHLCNSPWLKRELLDMGIKAHVVYQPMDFTSYEPAPLPEEPTVAVYFTDTNPMYNLEFMLDVAAAMPDIKFKFFGGFKLQPPEKNIQYMGRVTNMPEFIKSCTMNVRISVHDGFPITPVQFAMMGRECIVNSQMPYMHRFTEEVNDKNYINAKAVLTNMIRAIVRIKKPEKELLDLRKYYGDLMSPDRYKKIIHSILEQGRDWKPDPTILVAQDGIEEVSLAEITK